MYDPSTYLCLVFSLNHMVSPTEVSRVLFYFFLYHIVELVLCMWHLNFFAVVPVAIIIISILVIVIVLLLLLLLLLLTALLLLS